MKLIRDPSEQYPLNAAPVLGVELDGVADVGALGSKLAKHADVAFDVRFGGLMPDTVEARQALHLQQALFDTLAKDSNPGLFSLRAVDKYPDAFIKTHAAARLLEQVVEGPKFSWLNVAKHLVRSEVQFEESLQKPLIKNSDNLNLLHIQEGY